MNERECACSSEWPTPEWSNLTELWFTKFILNSTLCMFSTVSELSECGKRGRESLVVSVGCLFFNNMFELSHLLCNYLCKYLRVNPHMHPQYFPDLSVVIFAGIFWPYVILRQQTEELLSQYTKISKVQGLIMQICAFHN